MALLLRSVVLVMALTGAHTEASRLGGGPISFPSRRQQQARPSSLYSAPRPPSSLYSAPRPPSSLYSAPRPPSSLYSAPKPPSSLYSAPRPHNTLSPAPRPHITSSLQSGNTQFGETSATSVQTSSGKGQQTNQGQATGVSTQQQSNLGGATQVTNNQGLIQALQEANGGGRGNGQQSSNNQVNIESNQLQQNVQGTLVNVNEGNMGIVVVNTNGQVQTNAGQQVIDGRPVGPPFRGSSTAGSPFRGSSFCRFACRRPLGGQLYCCDDGSNTGGQRAIHGGQCPKARVLCTRNVFFRKCGHDGQCAGSDKCCYDTCAEHHICKSADLVQ